MARNTPQIGAQWLHRHSSSSSSPEDRQSQRLSGATPKSTPPPKLPGFPDIRRNRAQNTQNTKSSETA